MGLLDSLSSVLGEGAKNLQGQALNSMLENVLGKGHPEISKLLKDIDMSKVGEIVELFKKNGVPDTKEEIQELLNAFTKSAKTSAK